MAAAPNRIQMIRYKPVDVWTVKEKLSLACSVRRSGDQNWVSVSRAIKPFGEKRRPPDWFNQKNCALQYADMLDKVETPKRKRGDQGHIETPGDQIIRKLTIERIEELKRMVQEEQQEYKKLKSERDAIRAGEFDDTIKEKYEECLALQKAREDKEAELDKEATELAENRAAAAAAAKAALKPAIPGQKSPKKPVLPKLKVPAATTSTVPVDIQQIDDTTQDSMLSESISVDVMTDDEFIVTPSPSCTPKPTPPASPFLSTLLQKLPESTPSTLTIKNDPDEMKVISPEFEVDIPAEISGYDDETPSAADEVESQSVDMKTEPTTPSSGVPSTLTKLLVSPVVSAPSPIKTNSAESEAKKSVPPPTTPPSTTASNKQPSNNTPTTLPPKNLSPVINVKAEAPPPPPSSVASLATPVIAPSKTQSSPIPVKTTDDESQDVAITTQTKPEVQEEVKQAEVKEEIEDSNDKSVDENVSTAVANTSSIVDVSTIDESIEIKEEPASPASSVSSKVSEIDKTSRRRRSSRGSGYRSRSARRSLRATRNTQQEKKDVDAESSDDETVPESDDTSSNKLPPPSSAFIESIPNSPASMSQCSDTEDEKVYKTWKKSIMLVWRAAANHKYANVFLHPVTNDIAPGYDSVVFRPKDLHTIKKHIETGVIKTTAEFQRDIMLMFTNATMYNNSDHNVFKMAQEMYDDVMQHIETVYTVQEQKSMSNKKFFQYVNTQLMLQANETKSLRGTRRSEASDKEDDARKRKTSIDGDTGGKSKRRKTRADD
ncbi:bromodomain-containing protein 8-like isoform X2 [Tubulanus polymorphus]|uniref:bromodomain-containing protein 8-like isoform X2 n=1 Tax=Tubulanus polymorphus TaxID=672921 RepID=UPI003DA2ADD6